MKVPATIMVSLVVHAALGWAVARAPRPAGTHKASASVVEMSVVEHPKPPPPPPTEPPTPAPAAPQPTRARPAASPPRTRLVRATAPAAAAPADTVAVPAAPLDFTADPAIPIGGGPDLGPATPAARPGPVARQTGTGTVPLADLSRPPSPPALDDALARRYPAEARAAGRTGRAVVRARIDPDGRAHVLRVVGASDPSFGEACRATVDGSRWQPPLDAGGKAVATEVSYTCNFEVG